MRILYIFNFILHDRIFFRILRCIETELQLIRLLSFIDKRSEEELTVVRGTSSCDRKTYCFNPEYSYPPGV